MFFIIQKEPKILKGWQPFPGFFSYRTHATGWKKSEPNQLELVEMDPLWSTKKAQSLWNLLPLWNPLLQKWEDLLKMLGKGKNIKSKSLVPSKKEGDGLKQIIHNLSISCVYDVAPSFFIHWYVFLFPAKKYSPSGHLVLSFEWNWLNLTRIRRITRISWKMIKCF